jgi:hypothetical protein
MSTNFSLLPILILFCAIESNAQNYFGTRVDIHPEFKAPGINYYHDTAAGRIISGTNKATIGAGVAVLYSIELGGGFRIVPEISVTIKPVKYSVNGASHNKTKLMLNQRLFLEKQLFNSPVSIYAGGGFTFGKYAANYNSEYKFTWKERIVFDIAGGVQYKKDKLFITGRISATALPFAKIVYESTIDERRAIEILGHGSIITLGVGWAFKKE